MSEWDQREVCPDGGCVGVLGSDGACKACGKRGRAADAVTATAGAEGSGNALRGEATDFDEDDEYYYEDEDDDGEDSDDDDDEGEADSDEEGVATVGWSDRKLCPDGGCVGVIGDNGSCKVCGRGAG